MVIRDPRTNQVSPQRLERRECAVLISPDQTRVANYVSGHNGGEAAFHIDFLPPERVVDR